MPVIVYKPVSKTPLEMVNTYKHEHPEVGSFPVGYAGRLDPMAEGLLLLLIGDENKERKRYEKMEKEYVFEILFGFSTDSYDLMGMITEQSPEIVVADLQRRISDEAASLIGIWTQAYPPYSSAIAGGRPLYWWSRQKRLAEIQIPSKEITVKELTLVSLREADGASVGHIAADRIQHVKGDFRQEEIIKQWQRVAAVQTRVLLPVARCRVVCSSGTYVRGLAHLLGRALGVPALAYSIKRIRIGNFTR